MDAQAQPRCGPRSAWQRAKASRSPGRNSNGSGKGKDKKDTSKIPCKFFKTSGGCRLGDACKFKHA